MESFLNDINGIHVDIVDAELNAEQLIAVCFRIKLSSTNLLPSIDGQKMHSLLMRPTVIESDKAHFAGISNRIYLSSGA